MKIGAIFIASALVLTAALSHGQSGPMKQTGSPSLSSLTGVWRGQMNGLPAITLVITDESGVLSGAVLFYLQKRPTVNDPYTATPGLPEPLFNPTFDGKTLVFEISHRRAHPPRTLSDPPVAFHMKLTGPDKAELVNDEEGSRPGLPMVRTDY